MSSLPSLLSAARRPRRSAAWLYLRRDGTTGRALSWGSIKHRWRRYRMRQKLRAVQMEDLEARRRERRNRNDRTLH